MDLQRYLLIAAIAVLSYMLLTEWNQFQQAQQATDSAAVYSQRPEATDADLTGTDLTETDDSVPRSDDLPTLENAAAPTGGGNHTIHVQTDVLELVINRRGGDVEFAALPQHLAELKGEQPFVVLENNARRTYVAQSGLIGPNGVDSAASGRPLYETSAASYTLAPGSDELIVDLVHRTAEGAVVTKRFTLQRGSYLVDVSYLVDNQTDTPFRAAMFSQLKRDDTADPNAAGGFLGIHSYLGAATSTPDKPYLKLPFKEFADETFKLEREGGWIAMVQHYFLSAWVPPADQQNTFNTLKTRNGDNIARITSPLITIAPGAQDRFSAALYVGPKDQYALQEIAPGLDLTVDYGILWWIAQPLFWLLTRIHGVLGNWGWSIVMLTVIVKLIFFPLNAKAYRSMANMRKVQPKIMAIRERYPDDRQKQSAEMMNLYKTERINPLGGCLPILVQMPVFLALYWTLLESVELRHAPWLLWIDDLSAMDPYFILPLLMGVSMFFQQKLNPPPPDPMQAKVMQWLPVMFTFFFLWFPAGLVLYWVVNNVLSIAQQYVITRRIEQGA